MNEVRNICLEVINTVLTEKVKIDEALSRHHIDHLDEQDKKFCWNLIYSTFRYWGQTQVIVARYLKKPLKKSLRKVDVILRMGLTQMFYLNIPVYAAINTSVNLAKANRFHSMSGLVNAVLKKAQFADLEAIKAQDALPSWIYESWSEYYKKEHIQAIISHHQAKPYVDITVKDSKQSEQILEAFIKEGINAEKLFQDSIRVRNPGSIQSFPFYQQGLWWVQGVAASMPVHFFKTLKGKKVLEICAAPGGKTAQLAAAGAEVTAIEISEKRCQKLKENLNRLHLKADVIIQDFLEMDFLKGTYDALFIDAPCSATGTIRKHPELPWIKDQDSVDDLVNTQMKMLNHASHFLKKDGELIYCVCSLQKEEGVEQINQFLECHSDFIRKPIQASEIGGKLEWMTEQGDFLSLPYSQDNEHDIFNIDGIYAARLIKRK